MHKKPGCYHSVGKTHLRDGIFKLNPIHASDDLSDCPNSLNSMKVLFHLRKTPVLFQFTQQLAFANNF